MRRWYHFTCWQANGREMNFCKLCNKKELKAYLEYLASYYNLTVIKYSTVGKSHWKHF